MKSLVSSDVSNEGIHEDAGARRRGKAGASSAATRPFTGLRDVVVVDVETTELDPSSDRIVEVAAARGDLSVLLRGETNPYFETFEARVNPGVPIPAAASRVHGIRDKDVKDKDSFAEVAVQSKHWLHALCRRLFCEFGVAVAADGDFQVRAFDATTVKEPGKTRGLWRVHYSVRLPSVACDFFKLTPTEGPGTGESFSHFPIAPHDYIVADRGYSTGSGIGHVVSAGGQVTVRVNTASLVLRTPQGQPFDLLAAVTSLERAGTVASWLATVVVESGGIVPGRVCALRKTEQAIELAHERLRRVASRKGRQLKPDTLEFARYVIVFTTFPGSVFTASEVLEWYRIRWQVELVFKRFKSLAQLGHLPKYDDESAKAWLYGKLLVALLVEKLIRHAVAISPWGYDLEAVPPAQCMA